MNRRTSESSLVREYRQFLSLLVRKEKRTEKNHKDDSRFRIQNFQRIIKGIEIITQKKKKKRLNEGSFIHVVLVYE